MNRGTILIAIVAGAVIATSGLARADAPAAVLDLDEATHARCLAVLRAGLASSEFWPSMHAAEALSMAGQGADVRGLLAPKVPDETDDQRRCGLARELVRAGDLGYVQTMLDILAS